MKNLMRNGRCSCCQTNERISTEHILCENCKIYTTKIIVAKLKLVKDEIDIIQKCVQS